MTAETITFAESRLEVLPGWVWDARTDLWEQGYSRLVKYAEERGTSQVPNRYETEDGYALGSWLNTVRGRGVKGSLEPERMKQLEALPAWTWTPKADSWERAFNLLFAICRGAWQRPCPAVLSDRGIHARSVGRCPAEELCQGDTETGPRKAAAECDGLGMAGQVAGVSGPSAFTGGGRYGLD